LITDAQKVLTNPQVKPEDFDNFSTQLTTKIEAAQNVASPEDPQLSRLVELAHQAQQGLAEKSDLWKKFMALHKEVLDKQDKVYAPLDDLQKKGLQPVDSAQNIIDSLKVNPFVAM
jgi:hypothetical protein